MRRKTANSLNFVQQGAAPDRLQLDLWFLRCVTARCWAEYLRTKKLKAELPFCKRFYLANQTNKTPINKKCKPTTAHHWESCFMAL